MTKLSGVCYLVGVALSLANTVLVAGCGNSGGNSSQGGARQPCYPNGTCNAGLTCLSMVCVDARGDASAGVGGTAGSSGAAGSAAVGGGGGATAGTGGATSTAGSGGSGAGGTTGAAGVSGAAGQKDGGIGGGAGAPAADGGTGGPLANGAVCSRDDECLSTRCVDDRCCSVSACSTCQACTGAGGTCTPVAKREAASCNGSKSCDSESRCVYRFAEFPIGGTPFGLTSGPDGNIWFVAARTVDRIGVDGTGLKEFTIARSRAVSIVGGPDGNIWFTSTGDTGEIINRATVSFTDVVEFSLPVIDSLNALAVGADKRIWFSTELGRIGSMGLDGTGAVTFPAPMRTSCLTVAPDGNLWFADPAGKVGRIRPSDGRVTEFDVAGTGSQPLCITTGPDGNLWFTDWGVNQVGRIDPSGAKMTLFPLHDLKAQPTAITTGPDGRIWFAERLVNKIGRISPTTGAITEITLPTPNSLPNQITLGPDGNMWVTEQATNSPRIARVMP